MLPGLINTEKEEKITTKKKRNAIQHTTTGKVYCEYYFQLNNLYS